MTCDVLRGKGPNGEPFAAIICNRGKRRRQCSAPGCTATATLQCDYPLKDGRTCDRYVCSRHSVRQGVTERMIGDVRLEDDTRDFCLPHDDLARKAKAQPELLPHDPACAMALGGPFCTCPQPPPQ